MSERLRKELEEMQIKPTEIERRLYEQTRDQGIASEGRKLAEEALEEMQVEKQPSALTFENDPFDRILDEMSALHNKKGKDYGGATDPYANVRASAEFGVAPWIGALIRLNDKITRLKSFIRRGELVNESALDSIRDVAVYAVIMQVLYEEENGK